MSKKVETNGPYTTVTHYDALKDLRWIQEIPSEAETKIEPVVIQKVKSVRKEIKGRVKDMAK